MRPVIEKGRPAWHLSNGETELALTVRGGHMAPVTFFAGSSSPVEPYYISPWQEEKVEPDGPGVLKSLRGDFFCMPFGGDNSLDGEVHPPHGEVSESEWRFVAATGSSEDEVSIETELDTRIRSGKVIKRIAIRKGQSALYVSHRVEGFIGPVTLGHHAIMPGDRTHYLSCRPLITGISDTAPPDPSAGEYCSVPPGTLFTDLTRVPTIWKNPPEADYSVFPGRDGFVDILQVFPLIPDDGTPQWFTATVPSRNYLWYSLKNPSLLPSTVLWRENHGRHGSPWNGRNSCLGIEEVLGHLASGLRVSAGENELTRRGLRTSMLLDGKAPLVVKNIQGVCRIPSGFDRVSEVVFKPGKVVFKAAGGQIAEAALDWEFLGD